jgi:hypothetical protein
VREHVEQRVPEPDLVAEEGRAALVRQRRVGVRPSHVHLAEQLSRRDVHVGEEDLVELGVAGHLLQRTRVDARQCHVDQQVRQSLVFGHVLVGPAQQQAPVGDVRERGPDLLAVHHEVIALEIGARLHVREIASGVRLREALAPDLLHRKDRRQVPLLLLLGTVGHDRRPGEVHPYEIDEQLRRAGPGHLLVEDDLLHVRCAAAAVLLRPVKPRVSGFRKLLLPRLGKLDALLERAGFLERGSPPAVGEVCADPLAHLRAERVLFG